MRKRKLDNDWVLWMNEGRGGTWLHDQHRVWGPAAVRSTGYLGTSGGTCGPGLVTLAAKEATSDHSAL